MSKAKAIVLGVITTFPIAYIIFFISFFISTFTKMVGNGNVNNTFEMFKIIFPIHLSIMILMVVLLVIYIKDVFKNTSIESEKRTLWALVLFFGNIIAMPVYWFAKIWKPITRKSAEEK